MNEVDSTVAAAGTKDHEGHWRAEREQVYRELNFSHTQQRDIEALIRLCPARKVGKGALRNLRGRLPSKKCKALRPFESHTVERLFLYQIELDPSVVGYLTQVPLVRVERRLANNRRHVSTPILDALIFTHKAITIVECKDEDWLRKREGTKGWSCHDGVWTCEPYARWADEHGLEFRVWHPPYPFAIYLRNMELIYARVGEALNTVEEGISKEVINKLRTHACTIAELRTIVPEITGRIITIMLGDGRVYGTVRSYPIANDQFLLFGREDEAVAADEALLASRAIALGISAMPEPRAAPSVASAHLATVRLQRLQKIDNKQATPTRRMKRLAMQVAIAQGNGITPFAACIPDYAACGNRLPRLSEMQACLIRAAVDDFQKRNPPITIMSAHALLANKCREAEVSAPSITTLSKALRAQDPARRALAIGGMRAYQAEAPRSDPRFRSGKAFGYMHTVHIDSSKRDVRASPELQQLIELRRAIEPEPGCKTHDTFYIAIDEATGDPVGHAFVVGPARVDAMAILMRQIVFNCGVLPRVIVFDRGPENVSNWMLCFCMLFGITIIHTPSGGSRYNGEAERLIRQINTKVSHRLPGSTLPDKAGRSVDPKFKSLATAKFDFLRICKLIESLLYEDIPNIPGPTGETPIELRDAALNDLGNLGIPCLFDDAFLFETSERWEGGSTCSEQRGIRIGNHDYTSLDIRNALRIAKPQELRLDSVDPCVLHTVIGGRHLIAYEGSVQQSAVLKTPERLWQRLVEPVLQSAVRGGKSMAESRIALRMERARKAGSTNAHLSPDALPGAAASTGINDHPGTDWSDLWDNVDTSKVSP